MEPKKVFYSLSEVMALTELPAATLRYWEQRFDELSPRKDGHGNRYYTEQDLTLIKQIKYIRDELKITRIEAIRNELKSGSRNTDARQRATEILLRLRQQLVDLRASI
ncbi:MAG: MerR family transcriptional regulator [Paludibacteraceae bacterium]|nr:MerR family transcriptional regulator [Paludibacteraceae bacterium]